MAMKRNGYRWNTRNFMNLQRTLLAGVAASLLMLCASSSFAWNRYNDGCADCHGDFRDDTSPKGTLFSNTANNNNKHDMHRYTMGTDCDLCHSQGSHADPFTGSSAGTDDNPGLGCAGCHMELGLRAHHVANGMECHGNEGPPPDESDEMPTYYGTVDTLADNPCNDVLASNTNENWTVGDFLGLDNDGDNLYDLADYSCGPLRMVEVIPDGDDLHVFWETAGGRSERIQATAVLTNGFSDVGTTTNIPGVGIVTQEVVLVNGATGPVGFYQVRSDP
jgi:hypothetical protein